MNSSKQQIVNSYISDVYKYVAEDADSEEMRTHLQSIGCSINLYIDRICDVAQKNIEDGCTMPDLTVCQVQQLLENIEYDIKYSKIFKLAYEGKIYFYAIDESGQLSYIKA
jgi:hypothetical protein